MVTTGATQIKGWVLYDGACGFCRRWAPLWERALAKRGFLIAPLQSEWVAEKLGRPQEELISDFRLLLADGEQLAGADAYRYLMRRIWWARPVYLLSILPVFRTLFDLGYRLFADNRFWISRRIIDSQDFHVVFPALIFIWLEHKPPRRGGIDGKLLKNV